MHIPVTPTTITDSGLLILFHLVLFNLNYSCVKPFFIKISWFVTRFTEALIFIKINLKWNIGRW